MTNSQMTTTARIKRTRNKITADKKELRLVVKRELYDLFAKHAERYGESVGTFVRHLMVERTTFLERSSSEGSTSVILALLRQFTDLIHMSIDDPKEAAEFQESVDKLCSLVRKYTK